MSEKRYRRNIILNYFFIGIKNLNLTHGMWLIYLAARGFSLFEIGILESVFHITSLIMETPTGAIADLYGRKTSRILGLLLYIVYLILMLTSTSYIVLVVAFVICGLSYNLETGAGEALVYDSLKEINEEKRFMKVNGINEVAYQLASAIGIFIGGYVAVKNYGLMFKLNILIMLVAILVVTFMKETQINKTHHKMSIKDSIYKQYKDSFRVFKSNGRLLFLAIILSFIGTLITVSFFYSQNYWRSLGYLEDSIGFYLALHSLFAAFGGYMAHKIERILKEKGILLIIPSLIIVMLWGLTIPKLSFYALMILGTLDSIFYVVLSDYMNRIIPSEQRATLISFSSMVFSLFMILIFPIFGYIGDILTINDAFVFLASIGTITFVIYYVRFNKFIKT